MSAPPAAFAPAISEPIVNATRYVFDLRVPWVRLRHECPATPRIGTGWILHWSTGRASAAQEVAKTMQNRQNIARHSAYLELVWVAECCKVDVEERQVIHIPIFFPTRG